MSFAKKVFFPLISLFLAYRSYELVKVILKLSPEEVSIVGAASLSFMLTLFVTGIFAFVGFAYPTHRVLPASYYVVSKPESLMALYRLLGVSYFRKFLLITFWGKPKNRKKYFDGSKAGLANFDYQTKQSEFGHLAAFVCLSLLSIPLIQAEHWTLLLFITVINVLANFYPIVLQRVHRIQIQKLRARILS
ncbi:hypothetical protein [Penaeicola halotolerans]|uniref:glycosyl-4,4'-diaponeurosporenoate acyltransferase CrtO family protein n=1 Tax=Penaeicola halotolerans TaxID=2793196 RepID=UPI001CF852C8|nr:hypothetical protein [Penaeicola halotolerans]